MVRRALADPDLILEDTYKVTSVKQVKKMSNGDRAIALFTDPGGYRVLLLADIVSAR